jgi:Curli assembly protein CsgE
METGSMQLLDKVNKTKTHIFLVFVRHFCGILLLFLLAPRQLAAQNLLSPVSDSSRIWLEIVADDGQNFRVRGYFLNQKNYPRYLFWRSQTVRGFDRKRESGDFVALTNDTTLVFENEFLIDTSETRELNFYVLDNDLIIGKTARTFVEIKPILAKKAAELRQIEQEAAILTEQEAAVLAEIPPEIAENKTVDSPIFSENKTAEKIDSTAKYSKNNPERREQNVQLTTVETPKIAPKTTDGKPFLAKDEFEIDGIVTNEVRTNFGRQFWSNFQENWQPPEKIGGYWISIKEILTPGRYTIISVSLNNRELFQRYLNPNPEYLKDLATQTADFLVQILKNGDPDGGFTNEDLNGVGIEN